MPKWAIALFTVCILLAGPTFAQTYVGDDACSYCHSGKYNSYMESGHPWKLFQTAGEEPPADTWPHTPVPPLPVVNGTQLQWSDVEYTIGNFFWKTRFIDPDGYIYTGLEGETTQWNLASQEWVAYHAGEVDKPYDCGRCHTTGYDPDGGNQNGLPGLIGTWAQDGVRCEACHGPASDHISDPYNVHPPGGQACTDCHYRDAEFRMPWKSGFMRHHQQAEEFSHSSHKDALVCVDCHNPHNSTVYDLGGVTTPCSTCHPGDGGNNNYVVAGMEGLDCTDCHMPLMAKSAVAVNEHKADVHGHLFQIMTDPIAAADNVYDVDGSLYWNQDEFGDSFITLDYACMGCHEEMGNPLTLDQASAFAKNIHNPNPTDYIGDAACSHCHADMPVEGFFDGYMRSGHPWKLYRTGGETPEADTWPFTPVPPLPVAGGAQLDWPDVEYVIGNYFWKTRFIDPNGYIYTGLDGETTQWNIASQEWVAYHAGEVDKPYDCGRCHTTGYDPDGGNQNGLPGLIGTWAQDGVRCEACHGPATGHARGPVGNPPPGGNTCADCHYRDAEFRMPWKSGFMRHHQQAEDFSHSTHKDVLSCETCHNPHRSTVYNEGGMTIECVTCHPGNEENNFYSVFGMETVECINCHMPYMAKSAVAVNEHKADVHGHLFRIMTEPIAAAENVYEVDGALFWNQDGNGDAAATVDYACLGCHTSGMSLEFAAGYAQGIHMRGAAGFEDPAVTITRVMLERAEPNPCTQQARIIFALPGAMDVRLTLFDVNGRALRTLVEGERDAGTHSVLFDREGLASGLYFYRLDAGGIEQTERLVLID